MINQKEIGGYMELELPNGKEYYEGPSIMRLNTGRACIYYALKKANVKKVYLPHYLCTSMFQAPKALGIDVELYYMDEQFRPKEIHSTSKDEAFLYINYFGTGKKEDINEISKNHEHFLLDNTQSFYSPPLEKAYNLYSPRKFFGVSDGGYLIKENIDIEDLPQDISYKHASHLFKRIEEGANSAYKENMDNENRFDDFKAMGMSKLTRRILQGIDYEKVKIKRERNFYYLHQRLKDINGIDLSHRFEAPMIYPFLIEKKGLREHLVSNRIYVPTWWNDVLKRVKSDSFEAYLSSYLVPLPIDQRYSRDDMDIVLGVIDDFLRK